MRNFRLISVFQEFSQTHHDGNVSNSGLPWPSGERHHVCFVRRLFLYSLCFDVDNQLYGNAFCSLVKS
jgi:hypothetical protein